MISDVQDENDKFKDFDIPSFIPSSDLQNRRNVLVLILKSKVTLSSKKYKEQLCLIYKTLLMKNINNIMVKLILNSSVVAEK